MRTSLGTLKLLEQQRSGILDQLLDADQELDGFAAVDEAVVVGERQVHHRADHDLAVRRRSGAAGSCACRGCRPAAGSGSACDSSEPKMPPLVIVNVPPRRSSSVSVLSRRLLGEVARSRCSISAKDLRSASRTTGTTSPSLGADGDADVVVVLEDDLVALDLGVELRERLQRADRGLGEERHEAEADAVALLERLACGARAAP